MSNIHEYVIFDRAKVDPALTMRWPEFDQTYPGWCVWESAREFLIESVLNEAQIGHVDEIFARKTLRATLRMSDGPFSFLHAILFEKKLWECHVEINFGDYDYGDDIVSCAGAGYIRGDLSLAALTAVCALHANRVRFADVLPYDVGIAVLEQAEPPLILPGLPGMKEDEGADCIGVSQSRRVIAFLLQAWRERWPLHGEGQKPRKNRTIRSCAVANDLVKALRKRRLIRPCMFRWFEC